MYLTLRGILLNCLKIQNNSNKFKKICTPPFIRSGGGKNFTESPTLNFAHDSLQYPLLNERK